MTDIVLGGRTFAPANFDRMTSLMECHVMSVMRRSGIDRIMPELDDTDASWLLKLQAGVLDSGHMHELIAAYLLPVGTTERDWTREKAAEISRFLELVDTPEDRARIHELAVEVAFGFFARGVESLKRSQSALEAHNASNPPNKPQLPPNMSDAAASTPATGRRWFGLWRRSITTDAKRSHAGRSASS